MRFGKKMVIAVDLGSPAIESLKALRHLELLKHGEVHLVYVFQTSVQTFGLGFGEVGLFYPGDKELAKIEQSVLATLAKKTEEWLPIGTTAKVYQHCLFSDSPKEEFCRFAEGIHADTLIVMTRERHGIFESSFAQYVSRHSKAHTLILHP